MYPDLETVEKVPFYCNFRISAADDSALLGVYSPYTPSSGFIIFARNSEISWRKDFLNSFLKLKMQNHSVKQKTAVIGLGFRILVLHSVLCAWGLLAFPSDVHAGLLVNRTLYLGLTNGLVGHWTFDGKDMGGAGITATDISGRGNHGTLTSGPARAIGRIGQGMEFDGDKYLDTDNDSVILSTLTPPTQRFLPFGGAFI